MNQVHLIKTPVTPARIAVRFIVSMLLTLGFSLAFYTGAIHWLGAPASSGYSTLPTVFYLSSFPMVAAGGSLGFAISSARTTPVRRRLMIPLLFGALFLGWQSYALWCLPEEEFAAGRGSFLASLILAVAHLLCYVAVFVLLNFAVARIQGNVLTANERFLLQVCSVAWFALGLVWVFLLCIFAAML
ncbi:MAG TPA: hypothetical protein VNQ76_07805 [Planctomicrobium sp.]|nr:hypothetical protein [Planctomicrobium sp.]